jgi:hypothetical protein
MAIVSGGRCCLELVVTVDGDDTQEAAKSLEVFLANGLQIHGRKILFKKTASKSASYGDLK